MATDTEQLKQLEANIIENLRVVFEQLKEMRKISPTTCGRIILAIDGHLKAFPLSLDETGPVPR